jgi:hypothetical protein
MLSSIVPRPIPCPYTVLTVMPICCFTHPCNLRLLTILYLYLLSFLCLSSLTFYMSYLLYPGLSLVCIPYLLSCYCPLCTPVPTYAPLTILYYLFTYLLSSYLPYLPYMSISLYPVLPVALHTVI